MADATLPTPIPQAAPDEEWRPIEGCDRKYWISSHGRIWSCARVQPRIIAPALLKNGYFEARLYIGGQRGRQYVHRLVLAAFVGPLPEGGVTRHLDGDPLNNRLGNLRYGTVSENLHDSVRHGTHFSTRKTHCPAGHSYSDPVHVMVNGLGRRRCRTCMNTSRNARRRQAREAAA